MDDADRFKDLVLDTVEAGQALLVFETLVGPMAKFGYHRGRWVLVLDTPSAFTVQSSDRERVSEAMTDTEDISVHDATEDRAWQWLVNEGIDEHEIPMHKAYCTCGEYKLSSSVNVIQRWNDSHDECYSSITIDYDDRFD